MTLKRTEQSGYALFMMVFESVMSVFYLFLAYLLIFTERFETIISSPFRFPLGVIFALYGCYRIFRSVRKLIVVNNEKDEE